MPYVQPSRQREYQRNWVAARRRRYLDGRVCEHCGTAEGPFELNHRVPLRDAPRKHRHRFWSLCPAKLEAELALTEVLCKSCHRAESLRTGVAYPGAKLTVEDVRVIRTAAGSVSVSELAERYKVTVGTIRAVIERRTFRNLPDVDGSAQPVAPTLRVA